MKSVEYFCEKFEFPTIHSFTYTYIPTMGENFKTRRVSMRQTRINTKSKGVYIHIYV